MTEPLLAYYASRGLVVEIDGTDTIDGVFAAIVEAVDALSASSGSATRG